MYLYEYDFNNMNKKSKILVIISFINFLLLVGCSKKDESTSKIFPIERHLDAQIVPFNYIIDRGDFIIIDDFIVFSSSKTDTLIHIFSLPNINHIESFGIVGQGPGEFQNSTSRTIIRSNYNMLCLSGFNSSGLLIKCFDIDKQSNKISLVKDYPLDDITTWQKKNYHIINDSILFYYELLPYKLQLVSYNLQQKNASIKEMKVTETHELAWAYHNSGSLKVNSDAMVYMYLYQDRVMFMDHDFSEKSIIIGGNKNYNIDIHDHDNIIYHYIGGRAGKTKFYLFYLGCSFSDYYKGKRKKSIEVFDNKGNPLIKYYLNNHIYDFVVDEKRNKIYAFGEDDDSLLVFDLDE